MNMTSELSIWYICLNVGTCNRQWLIRLQHFTVSRHGSPASIFHTCRSLSPRATRPCVGSRARVTLLSSRFSASDWLELVDKYLGYFLLEGSLSAWALWTVSEFPSGSKSDGSLLYPPLHNTLSLASYLPCLMYPPSPPISPCSPPKALTCTQLTWTIIFFPPYWSGSLADATDLSPDPLKLPPPQAPTFISFPPAFGLDTGTPWTCWVIRVGGALERWGSLGWVWRSKSRQAAEEEGSGHAGSWMIGWRTRISFCTKLSHWQSLGRVARVFNNVREVLVDYQHMPRIVSKCSSEDREVLKSHLTSHFMKPFLILQVDSATLHLTSPSNMAPLSL